MGYSSSSGSSDGEPRSEPPQHGILFRGLRRSRSTDGGQTWQPSVDVHQYIDFLTDRTSPRWLGDYIGFWLQGTSLYMSYADNAGQFSHIGFAKAMTP